MNDESALRPDEETMLVDSKPQVGADEAAGKASTTKEGGLAKLLFGKGGADKEGEEKMVRVEDGSTDKQPINEEVKLEDI